MSKSASDTFFGIVLALLVTAHGMAADWPTWRADVARSGVSPDTLPPQLELLWAWELPPVQPAFPYESRLQFDVCYEPVSAAGRVVFGSPTDGTIRSLDAATGEERWRFFTEGPVRAAPVLWQDRVIAGSDDGWLYCLTASDGTLAWKRRLAPDGRPDLRHLGGNRLISPWPVRGAPVVADGVVYAGSGVWPTMGVFVWALDAASGKVLWCNDRVNWIQGVRIDHNMTRDMGLTPCGYLGVSGDRLVVPNGRSHPAGLRRTDGELIYYVQGYRNGHCRVALSGIYGFVGKTGVISLQDFREVASRWAQAGATAPEGYDGAKIDYFEGPIVDYKSVPGCDAFSVFDGTRVYGLYNGVFVAYDLQRAALSEQTVEKPTGPQHPYRWDVPVVWRYSTAFAGKPGRTLIKADNRLIGCSGTTVMALDLTGPAARPGSVSWQADLGQPAVSLAAADGRLFAATRQGKLFCFGKASGRQAQQWTETAGGQPPTAGTWRAEALRLAQAAAVTEGFAVVRSGGADAVAGLVQGTALWVIAPAEGEAGGSAMTRQLSGYGLLGPRATVVTGSAVLPPYLATLTVVAEADLPQDLAGLWSTVHPYGGVLAVSAADPEAVVTRLRGAHLPGAVVSSGERLVLARRAGALAGSAAWTHESADVARTYFSRDQLVQPPLGVLWYGEGPGYGFFKVHDYGLGHKPEVVNGRVVALQQSSGMLVAYDAYTGRVLWQEKVADRTDPATWVQDGSYEWSWTATGGPTPRYACHDDLVYVAFNGTCRVLDAISGKESARWDFTDLGLEGVGPAVKGIFVTPDQVVVLAGYSGDQAIESGLWDGELLVTFARQSGERLWVRSATERFNVKAVAALDGTVYCVDSISPLDTERWRRRGGGLTDAESTLYALEAATGRMLWERSFRYPYKVYGGSAWTSIMARDDWVAVAAEAGLVLCGREGQTRAVRAVSGEVLWEKPCGSQPFIVSSDTFMSQEGEAFRLVDGTSLGDPQLFTRGGCNYGVAGEHLAFVRDYSAMWVDTDSGQRYYARNLRAGCSASLVAADGLLNAPNFSPGCMCNYPIQTCSAWVHMPGIESWAGAEPLTMRPPRGDNGVPKITPEAAGVLREQASPNVCGTQEQALAARLGEWTFDGGGTLAEAVSAASGGTSPTHVEGSAALAAGVAGQCLVLSGAGRLVCMLPPDKKPRLAVSLCAWIRPDAKQPYAPGFAGIVECAQVYRLCLVNTEAPYAVHFGVQLSNGTWASANSEKKLPAGQWTHVAGTFDGDTGECRLFINGEETARGTCSPGLSLKEQQGPLHVGVRDGSAYLSGAVDEVRVYRGTLSSAVVKALRGNR